MPSRAASLARSAIVDAPVSTTSSSRRPSILASVQKCPPLPRESVTLREFGEFDGEVLELIGGRGELGRGFIGKDGISVQRVFDAINFVIKKRE